MIVRISGEDQYRLADEDMPRLNELDNAVVVACDCDGVVIERRTGLPRGADLFRHR